MAPIAFGWRKDKRDERDFLHAPFRVVPDCYDLSAYLADVRDQGNLGSCTGFGIGGNLTGTAKQLNAYTEWFSPVWIYNGARVIEGSLPYDDGAEPRDCLDFLLKNGCLLEHFRPYKDTLDKTDPKTWGLGPEAAKWTLLTYVRITDGADNICSAIADGHFVSIGAPWYESWMDIGSDGVLPAQYGFVAGGHETFLYGYDKVKQVFYGQNSWGTSWGKGGRYVMPFSAIAAFETGDGYDAHYVTASWGVPPPPPEPPPIPPVPPVPPTPTPTPSPCALKLMYRVLTGQKQLKVEETTNSGKTWRQVGPVIILPK